MVAVLAHGVMWWFMVQSCYLWYGVGEVCAKQLMWDTSIIYE